jgi:hypothetical protein
MFFTTDPVQSVALMLHDVSLLQAHKAWHDLTISSHFMLLSFRSDFGDEMFC